MTDEQLEALPLVVDIKTAGSAFGLHPRTSRSMAADGTFPVPILMVGKRRKVTKHQLLVALGKRPAT